LAGQLSYDNTPYFHLGTNYDGNGFLNANERELNGRMDEAYVFSTELSASAVRDLAQVTQTWVGGNGNGADPTKWMIPKVPATVQLHPARLRRRSAYTVTVDHEVGAGEILD